MEINLIWDASVKTAPTAFKSDMAYAARQLDRLITDNIRVNLRVGWGEQGGETLPWSALAEGGPIGGASLTYNQWLAGLAAHAGSLQELIAVASLPYSEPSNLSGSLYISPSQEKAWGMLAPFGSEIDGAVGISSVYASSYAWNPNHRAMAGKYDIIGIAEHEMTHAMGRMYGDGAFALSNFASPGVLEPLNVGGYFSLDGGHTALNEFAQYGDISDWQSATPTNDAFNFITKPGVHNYVTQVDAQLMVALGFHVAASALPPTANIAGIRTIPPSKMSFI